MPPASDPIRVRALESRDRPGLRRLLAERWGSDRIVTRGRLHAAGDLPGRVAVEGGRVLGYLTFRAEAAALEIVTLDALARRRGVGRRLVAAVVEEALARSLARLWLVTTNDNLPAQAFWEAVGFVRVAVHEGAVEASRRLKPEIPERGVGGAPIRDEVEYERTLGATGQSAPAR